MSCFSAWVRRLSSVGGQEGRVMMFLHFAVVLWCSVVQRRER